MAIPDRLPTVWKAEEVAGQNAAARAARLRAVPLRDLCAEIRRRMALGGTVAEYLRRAIAPRRSGRRAQAVTSHGGTEAQSGIV